MFMSGQTSGFGFLGVIALSVLGLAGCGAEAPGDGSAGSEEATAITSQELQGLPCNGGSIKDYTVSDGSIVFGPSTSTHYCALSRINGLNGLLRAHGFVDQWDGATWVVRGYATMSCVPFACFSHPSPNAVTWAQATYTTTVGGGSCTGSTNMFWDDSASVVQGIKNSGASAADVDTVGPLRWYLNATSHNCDGNVTGWGTTFFVGVPSSGDHVELSDSIISVGSSGGLPNVRTLIPLTEGFCYFKGIGTALAGSGNYARITRSGGNWVLSSTGSYASAECLLYAQH